MISAITVSCRPVMLRGCVEQVEKQDVDEEVEHVIVLDGIRPDEPLRSWLDQRPAIQVVCSDQQRQRYVFEKVGALRNVGIGKCRGDYIAILDDDNRWRGDHLSSLHAALRDRPDCRAAYSWRTLWNGDNTPHVVRDRYPWVLGGDVERQKILFAIQREANILTAGSHVVRDRYGFEHNGETVSCVDAGEWLLRRSVFDSIRFKEQMSYTELLYGFCDDYLFGYEMLCAGIKAECTQLPTLEYVVGGNSQQPQGELAVQREHDA